VLYSDDEDKEYEKEKEYKEEEEDSKDDDDEDKKPRRRIPYHPGSYPDPVDTRYAAHPSCHVNFSPYYNEREYKFGCLAEKKREVLAGDERRPTQIK
jgi:hypothetical protein